MGEFDSERRFGGLRRLYGATNYDRIRAARIAVVGLGGVGSWSAEALARCGVASLTLIDLDHVAESNINRQVQPLTSTLGQANVLALQERFTQIHPECVVHAIDAFVDDTCWPTLLPEPVDVVIDACDQVRAKAALCAWGLATGTPVICIGAAGGKQRPQEVETADIAEVTHDPLLASLRQRLRQHHGAPRGARIMGVRCVFSREPVKAAAEGCELPSDGTLNCHGYGSSVMVTSAFGMVAASEALRILTMRLD
jgi:tRNA A37 threonylcarbamoyladenosine dehydratase